MVQYQYKGQSKAIGIGYNKVMPANRMPCVETSYIVAMTVSENHVLKKVVIK